MVYNKTYRNITLVKKNLVSDNRVKKKLKL